MINSHIIPDTRSSNRGSRNSFSVSGRVLLSYRSARSPSPQLRFLALSAGLNPSTMQQLWDFPTARRDSVLRLVCISANSFALCLDSLTCHPPWNYFQQGNVRYLRYAGCRFKSFLLFSLFIKIRVQKRCAQNVGTP